MSRFKIAGGALAVAAMVLGGTCASASASVTAPATVKAPIVRVIPVRPSVRVIPTRTDITAPIVIRLRPGQRPGGVPLPHTAEVTLARTGAFIGRVPVARTGQCLVTLRAKFEGAVLRLPHRRVVVLTPSRAVRRVHFVGGVCR